ncbi:hypothetical protein [Rhizobium leguminosarum]|uniref:hypothetical protein n=1 Tax=Rhizobium leguminosarum TaxID=384 RepID=UPI0014414FC6|nr:hypothetical protein [Rhizobium leguminosarum]MBY5819037.1 hypothetical protein [Rhizobium leguminosarum]
MIAITAATFSLPNIHSATGMTSWQLHILTTPPAEGMTADAIAGQWSVSRSSVFRILQCN